MTADLGDDASIGPGALRMRVSRQRRRDGMILLPIEFRVTEVDRLIALGHLQPADRGDRNQVVQALYRFLDGALGGAHPHPPHLGLRSHE